MNPRDDLDEYETGNPFDDYPSPQSDPYRLMDALDEDRLAILIAVRRGCAAKFVDCEPQTAAALAGRIAELTAEIEALNPDAKPITGSAGAFLADLRTTTAPLTEPSYGDPQATYERAATRDGWRGWGESGDSGRADP